MSVSPISVTINDVLNIAGIYPTKKVHYQLTPQQLSETTVALGQGKLNDTGALLINTGEFTGRSPKDKYCVKDEITADAVHWNEFNIATTPDIFDAMHIKLQKHLAQNELWVRDAYVDRKSVV